MVRLLRWPSQWFIKLVGANPGIAKAWDLRVAGPASTILRNSPNSRRTLGVNYVKLGGHS
jgi:hypothetical protein